jgi:hypothetical protein
MIDRRLVLLGAAGAACLPALARAQDIDPGRWGFYAMLPGGTWTGRLSSGDTELNHYQWVRPNQVLRAEHRLAGTPFVAVETITPGPKAGQLLILTQENDRDEPTHSLVTLEADGSAVERFVGRTGRPERAIYTPVDDDHYRVSNEVSTDDGWREIWSIDVTRSRD